MPEETFEGHCTCKEIRYRIAVRPMLVHCCHCRWCQRETGSAFAINALVERDRVELLAGTPELVLTPSESGRGQKIARCPTCRVALWSHYGGGGDGVAFIRVGTLAEPDALPPEVHIYVASKQDWVILPDAAPAFAAFYEPAKFWSDAVKARYAATRRKPA
jgi:hypothetical protein